jgi:hypothetical protein
VSVIIVGVGVDIVVVAAELTTLSSSCMSVVKIDFDSLKIVSVSVIEVLSMFMMVLL